MWLSVLGYVLQTIAIVTNNEYWYPWKFQLKAMQEINCFLAGLLKANKTIILISVYRLKQYLHKILYYLENTNNYYNILYTNIIIICEHRDYYT